MAGRGAPPGNLYALKHGFYSKAIRKAARPLLDEANGLNDLKEEVSLLRLRLRQQVREHPEDIDLQIRLATAIARLERARFAVGSTKDESLRAATRRVLSDAATQLGLKFLPCPGGRKECSRAAPGGCDRTPEDCAREEEESGIHTMLPGR